MSQWPRHDHSGRQRAMYPNGDRAAYCGHAYSASNPATAYSASNPVTNNSTSKTASTVSTSTTASVPPVSFPRGYDGNGRPQVAVAPTGRPRQQQPQYAPSQHTNATYYVSYPTPAPVYAYRSG